MHPILSSSLSWAARRLVFDTGSHYCGWTMNDEAAAESPPRSQFDVPKLQSRLAEPAQLAQAAGPTTPRVASKSLWVVAAVAIAAVGAVAVLLVMYSHDGQRPGRCGASAFGQRGEPR